MDPAMLFMAMLYCPCVEDMVHVANVLYLSSYLVRDILWLRLLTIFAGLSLLPFIATAVTMFFGHRLPGMSYLWQ